MKFGGTSVGSAQAMRETADLILRAQKRWGQVVVIASGMGSKPVKVTDLLLQGAHTAVAGAGDAYKQVAEQLRLVHYEAIDGLLKPDGERQRILAENNEFINRFAALCQAVHVLGELTPRALDAISGMGEQMSIRILAAYLRQSGHQAEAIDATELIVTDDNFQNAAPFFALTEEKTAQRLAPLFANSTSPLITGFDAPLEDELPVAFVNRAVELALSNLLRVCVHSL
jgi:aspartate kinase